MTSAIETFDLTRRFRRNEAVNGLNLKVPAGSIFALLGPERGRKDDDAQDADEPGARDARQSGGARRGLAAARPA